MTDQFVPTPQFDLTDDQREIQELARRFTADRITPFAAEWDEKHVFPRSTIKEAAELGFAAIYVSEASGGIALGRLEAALIMEAMSYGCPATSAFISIHNMASWMIDRFGGATVKAKYLPSLVTMDRLASYCLTEPSSGSDAAALKTRAVRDGDDWLVTGSKQFISGGGENEVYVTMVRTGEEGARGISCLVVEKDMPGVSFGAQERKLGWHAQPTAQVMFDQVRVPAENLVGGEGEGFRIAMMGLDGGRLNIGACSLGGAQRCLDETIAYTRERQQFGKAIADFQNTQFMLADMDTELQAARLLLYAAAAKVSANAPDKTRFAAMAKRLATDTGSSVVDRALQLHGGYGYLMDYPIERFWRDLRVHSILEGTNQVMRMIVGRELTRAMSDLVTSIEGKVGRIRLDRPAALHALTTAMCAGVLDALEDWRADTAVEAVVIDHASGRGFCAGGDIRMLAASGATDGVEARAFFFTEYRMNHRLFTYAKPVVAFMDGITMGGGVGLALPARYRVATENTRFAMPETGIGLFPDVGGGWYLSRLPGCVGRYLALTGHRLDGADCIALGLATDYLPSAACADAKTRIAAEPQRIEAVLAGFVVAPPAAPILAHRDEIDRLFAADTLEEIYAALEADGGEWALAQRATLRTKSPQTMKVALRLLHEGGQMADFAAEMAMEYAVGSRVVQRHDFIEGVRAVIVDKDHAPRWDPATPEGVTDHVIDQIFAPLSDADAWTPA